MKVQFRQKGHVTSSDFHGDVVVAGEKVEASKLPLRDGVLDLSHLPVVTIGGRKGRRQDALLAEFEAKAPDFKGVIFMLPYSWANGWSDGHLYIPSWDALNPRNRVSGGRPEVQFTNYRWLADGRYVADRARMLHGKAIEIIEAEVEQDVPMDELVKKLSNWHSYDFRHPLQQQCLEVWRELYDLEKRRAGITDKERDMSVLIREKLAEKFQEVGIRKATEIPADFSITAEEVAPELVAEAETLGTVEIPGVGRHLTKQVRPSFGWDDDVLAVELTIEEFRQVTSWPLPVYPVVAEIGDARHQLSYEMRDALASPEAERLPRLREVLSRRWRDVQRGSNFPKDIPLLNPKEEDLPPVPTPVEWGFDLITGEKFTAYPYLFRQYREGGWQYRWAESTEGAERFGCSYRQEAESFMTARKLETELTAEAEANKLSKAEVLRRRTASGEVLTNFGGHFRVMGVAGQCQYWVIQPNGTERDPDEVEHRKRYSSEGSKQWRLVGPEELAISWSKGNTAADHEFVVNKLPAGGCTKEQLTTIERLEREISERFDGTVGMSGKASPGIGKGWGFRSNRNSKPNPEPKAEPAPKNAEPINPSKVDLSKLFGGSAKIRR